MKISKIPGLGSFGHYVDDVDFNHLTAEEWLEIGKLHLQGLVTILRNVTISQDQYYSAIPKFGPVKSNIKCSKSSQCPISFYILL
jgi:alpha-ketoglutarate-dependent taurine dioxygenase